MAVRARGKHDFLGLAMQASGQATPPNASLLDQYESLGDKTTSYALRLLMALCLVYLREPASSSKSDRPPR